MEWVDTPDNKKVLRDHSGRATGPLRSDAGMGIGMLRGISLLSAIEYWMIPLDSLTVGYLMLDDSLPSLIFGYLMLDDSLP